MKVGDFGLSISTQSRDVSNLVSGVFEGTPQVASPEQIRGEPLDLRSDIYAVGATLYCLLAGAPPFDDADLTTLARRIGEETPLNVRARRRYVPRSLARIIGTCLAKERDRRPKDYASLANALRPFGSAAPTPAALGYRAIAEITDRVAINLALLPFMVLLGVPTGCPDALSRRRPRLSLTRKTPGIVLPRSRGVAGTSCSQSWAPPQHCCSPRARWARGLNPRALRRRLGCLVSK